MAYDDRALRGVGGWLALFIVVITIVSPVLGVLRLIFDPVARIASNAPIAPLADWVWLTPWWALAAIIVGTTLGQWFIAWRLVRIRRWTSVRTAVVGLWLLAGFDFIMRAAVSSAAFFMPLATVLAETGFGQVRPFVFSAIWTAYLLLSRRVRNTYRAEHDDGLHAVFE